MSGLDAKDFDALLKPWREAVHVAGAEIARSNELLRQAEHALRASMRATWHQRHVAMLWRTVAITQLVGVAAAVGGRLVGAW